MKIDPNQNPRLLPSRMLPIRRLLNLRRAGYHPTTTLLVLESRETVKKLLLTIATLVFLLMLALLKLTLYIVLIVLELTVALMMTFIITSMIAMITFGLRINFTL